MKKFAAPLQAFAVLLLCSGMAWMVFVLASINPTPPTAMDLKARNTQDLSFANMNSTAVALAKEMLADMAPSPSGIFLPVTGRETPTPQPAAAMTLRAVSTFENTPTPFSLLSFLIPPTATRERGNKPVNTATYTLVPTRTLQPPASTATATPGQVKSPSPTSPPPTGTPTDVPTKPPTDEPTITPSLPAPTDVPTEPPTNPPTEPPTNPPTESPPTATSEPIVATTEPPPP